MRDTTSVDTTSDKRTLSLCWTSHTLKNGKSCLACGVLLDGKKQKFCSPAHRAKWHRDEEKRLAQLLTISAAASELGVCRQTISKAIKSGRLKAQEFRTSGRPKRMITRGELERFRAGRKAPPLTSAQRQAEIHRLAGEFRKGVRQIAR